MKVDLACPISHLIRCSTFELNFVWRLLAAAQKYFFFKCRSYAWKKTTNILLPQVFIIGLGGIDNRDQKCIWRHHHDDVYRHYCVWCTYCMAVGPKVDSPCPWYWTMLMTMIFKNRTCWSQFFSMRSRFQVENDINM